MTIPLSPEHLAERAAERLLDQFDLGVPDREVPNAPAPSKVVPATKPDDPAQEAAPGITRDAKPPTLTPASAPALDLARLAAAGLVVCGARRSRVSEEYQVLSAQLLRTLRGLPRNGPVPGNMLMVTSAKPGEGKSFTALNLAASLARDSHAKTLLIDGDPKQNSLTARLDLSGQPGLFDLIGQDMSGNPGKATDAMVVGTAIDELQILPIGTITETHSATRHIASVLDRLARRFSDRILIVDAPPCLSTSDPSMLAPLVSQIVVVVEAEQTQRRDLEHALHLIEACPNVVLMLNKMRFETPHAFGAYGHYGA